MQKREIFFTVSDNITMSLVKVWLCNNGCKSNYDKTKAIFFTFANEALRDAGPCSPPPPLLMSPSLSHASVLPTSSERDDTFLYLMRNKSGRRDGVVHITYPIRGLSETTRNTNVGIFIFIYLRGKFTRQIVWRPSCVCFVLKAFFSGQLPIIWMRARNAQCQRQGFCCFHLFLFFTCFQNDSEPFSLFFLNFGRYCCPTGLQRKHP